MTFAHHLPIALGDRYHFRSAGGIPGKDRVATGKVIHPFHLARSHIQRKESFLARNQYLPVPGDIELDPKTSGYENCKDEYHPCQLHLYPSLIPMCQYAWFSIFLQRLQ